MYEEGSLPNELALAELRREVDVRLAGMEGQLALLLQRDEVHDRQLTSQAGQVGELDDRLARAEREQVTRSHLEARSRHTVALLAMLAAAASATITLLATVLT